MVVDQEQLDIIAQHFSSKEGFNAKMSKFAFQRMKPYLKGNVCLEVGCSDGAMTPSLLEHFELVVAIDGSPIQIERLRETKVQKSGHHLETFVTFVEDFYYKYLLFDTIVCSYILEHVESPEKVLTHLKTYLAPEGVILIIVPNAWSIHRLIALEAGLIGDLTDLSEQDRKDGHLRTFDPISLNRIISRVGLRIKKMIGVLLKPVPAGQMEITYPNMLEALYTTGEMPIFDTVCSSLLAVVENNEQ